ncbi:MAG TPA: hypothetical protein VLB80_03340 [Candidatus Babeliales bacterium]|nr:hypothetical protein [Candidatus Babeliales bacterium]
MSFVKLCLKQNYGNYSYKDSSEDGMYILGFFLTDDVGCSSSPFKEWALNDNWGDACSGNITGLEKEGHYILLSDLYSEEAVPTVLKLTKEQYKQILTDWKEKVCKLMPKEVIIIYDNDQFIIETKD